MKNANEIMNEIHIKNNLEINILKFVLVNYKYVGFSPIKYKKIISEFINDNNFITLHKCDMLENNIDEFYNN